MYNTIVLQLNNLVSKYFVSIPTHKSTCVGQLSHYPLLVSSSIINNVYNSYYMPMPYTHQNNS